MCPGDTGVTDHTRENGAAPALAAIPRPFVCILETHFLAILDGRHCFDFAVGFGV